MMKTLFAGFTRFVVLIAVFLLGGSDVSVAQGIASRLNEIADEIKERARERKEARRQQRAERAAYEKKRRYIGRLLNAEYATLQRGGVSPQILDEFNRQKSDVFKRYLGYQHLRFNAETDAFELEKVSGKPLIDGYIPFAFVIPFSWMSHLDQMERLQHRGMQGISMLRGTPLSDFEEQPSDQPHFIYDIEPGVATLGSTPATIMSAFERCSRESLTAPELVALCRHKPDILSSALLVALGSKRDAKKYASVYLEPCGAPTLAPFHANALRNDTNLMVPSRARTESLPRKQVAPARPATSAERVELFVAEHGDAARAFLDAMDHVNPFYALPGEVGAYLKHAERFVSELNGSGAYRKQGGFEKTNVLPDYLKELVRRAFYPYEVVRKSVTEDEIERIAQHMHAALTSHSSGEVVNTHAAGTYEQVIRRQVTPVTQ